MKKILLMLPLLLALTGCCTMTGTAAKGKKASAVKAEDSAAAIEQNIADKLEGVAKTERTSEGLKINLQGDVLFATNSSALEGKSSDVVNSVASILAKQGVKNVKVTGYTDNRGSEELNRQLSLDRAVAVKNRLAEKGVSGDIKAEGKGSSNPVASNDTREGRAQNRRVEILVQD